MTGCGTLGGRWRAGRGNGRLLRLVDRLERGLSRVLVRAVLVLVLAINGLRSTVDRLHRLLLEGSRRSAVRVRHRLSRRRRELLPGRARLPRAHRALALGREGRWRSALVRVDGSSRGLIVWPQRVSMGHESASQQR